MRAKTYWNRMCVTLLGSMFFIMLVPWQATAQTPEDNEAPAQAPRRCDGCTVDSIAGRRAWTILENDRVLIEGRHYPPGQRTDPPGQSHAETVPRDVLIMLLTPGDVEINTTGTDVRTGHFEAGTTWWWPKPPATHSIANVGDQPFDFIKISLK